MMEDFRTTYPQEPMFRTNTIKLVAITPKLCFVEALWLVVMVVIINMPAWVTLFNNDGSSQLNIAATLMLLFTIILAQKLIISKIKLKPKISITLLAVIMLRHFLIMVR